MDNKISRKSYEKLTKDLTSTEKGDILWWSIFNHKKNKRFNECLSAGLKAKTSYKKASNMEEIYEGKCLCELNGKGADIIGRCSIHNTDWL